MKFPNHIVLDISKKTISNSNRYWLLKNVVFLKTYFTGINDFFNYKKLTLHGFALFENFLLKNQEKFTFNYSAPVSFMFLNDNRNFFFSKVTNFYFKTKYNIANIQGTFFKDSKKNPIDAILKKIVKNLFSNSNVMRYVFNGLWSLFDINFLRKEKMYTKLKYSRVPQYDIVSGGAAALFAGFLGFLICEKFGFELVDSGDFYFLFMYLVFFFFYCRLFLKIMEIDNVAWNMISLKWLLNFFQILIALIINFIRNKK